MASNKRVIIKLDFLSIVLMFPALLMLYRHILRGEAYDPIAILAAAVLFFIGVAVTAADSYI